MYVCMYVCMPRDVIRTVSSTSRTRQVKEHDVDDDDVIDIHIHITSICLCYSIFVRSRTMFT
jgi:hypothetical protein